MVNPIIRVPKPPADPKRGEGDLRFLQFPIFCHEDPPDPSLGALPSLRISPPVRQAGSSGFLWWLFPLLDFPKRLDAPQNPFHLLDNPVAVRAHPALSCQEPKHRDRVLPSVFIDLILHLQKFPPRRLSVGYGVPKTIQKQSQLLHNWYVHLIVCHQIPSSSTGFSCARFAQYALNPSPR